MGHLPICIVDGLCVMFVRTLRQLKLYIPRLVQRKLQRWATTVMTVKMGYILKFDKEAIPVSTSVDVRISQRSVSAANYDVVIVGAGPYGLSTAAHLLEHGLAVAVFGRPMQLWREHMP